jgi:hypothetical protein
VSRRGQAVHYKGDSSSGYHFASSKVFNGKQLPGFYLLLLDANIIKPIVAPKTNPIPVFHIAYP